MASIAFARFLWDEANQLKCQKHGVSLSEIENVLSRTNSLVMPDTKNSSAEDRFIAIGQSSTGRYAFVISRRAWLRMSSS
ncbi:MAG: BrnT family toxin [Candidatus Binataceae bacterium]|jgi:uncharacterized DUF497 family protein